jgi:hypothetical protein
MSSAKRAGRLGACALLITLAPSIATATTIVEVRLESSSVRVGDTVRVDLYADLLGTAAAPNFLGWGLDLGVDPLLLQPATAPEIGPLWTPLPSADGDGLAGGSFPSLPAANDVLLASVTLLATAPGRALVFTDITPGDLTEGFALDPVGFAAVTLGTAEIEVIPEPGAGALLALGCAGALLCRRVGRRSARQLASRLTQSPSSV